MHKAAYTKAEAAIAIKRLRPFVSKNQLDVMGSLCYGPDRLFFIDKLVELDHLAHQMPKVYEQDGKGDQAIVYLHLAHQMPKVYEQDGKGDQAIVYLHYFMGGADWFITERDSTVEQHQAFGYADLGYGGELGYISIQELIENGAELDIHWTPKTLKAVKVAHPGG